MADRLEEKKLMGTRIKHRRIFLHNQRGGYTQKEVAYQLAQVTGKPVSRVGYAHYELGHNEVAATDLPYLAKVLECPVAYFFGDVQMNAVEDDDAVTYYRKLPDILKPAARAVLKALYETGTSR